MGNTKNERFRERMHGLIDTDFKLRCAEKLLDRYLNPEPGDPTFTGPYFDDEAQGQIGELLEPVPPDADFATDGHLVDDDGHV